jgi:hypothetical protein
MLAYRLEGISLYKFPENLYQQFKQIVLFGKAKKTPVMDDAVCDYLTDAGLGKVQVPFLPEEPEFMYEVPCSPNPKSFIYRTSDIDPFELEEEMRKIGLFEEIRQLVTPLTMTERITAIMPLRHGHLAQLIACGFINGIVFDKNRQNPLVVKGITKKIIESRVEIEGDREKHIETDRIVITIKAFTKEGELITIQ